MGCCVSRDEKALKDKATIVIDFNKKYTFSGYLLNKLVMTLWKIKNQWMRFKPIILRKIFLNKSQVHI